MKLKKLGRQLRFFFCTASLFALAAFTNGCCTQECLTNARQITIDKFNPTGLYQSEKAGKFALQGTYCDQRNYGDRITPANFFLVPRTNAFLIIPQKELASRHSETNWLYSPAKIKMLPPDIIKSLKPVYKLPASYIKIADFPTNNVILDVNQQHPNSGLIIMLPFAFAVDVIAFPFEALTALAFANSRGC